MIPHLSICCKLKIHFKEHLIFVFFDQKVNQKVTQKVTQK